MLKPGPETPKKRAQQPFDPGLLLQEFKTVGFLAGHCPAPRPSSEMGEREKGIFSPEQAEPYRRTPGTARARSARPAADPCRPGEPAVAR